MAKCKFCGEPVVSGIVAHDECLPRWIPVAERMPDHPNRHDWSDVASGPDDITEAYSTNLVLIFDGEIHLAEHFIPEDIWLVVDNGELFEAVTHWMPLPTPPEVTV